MGESDEKVCGSPTKEIDPVKKIIDKLLIGLTTDGKSEPLLMTVGLKPIGRIGHCMLCFTTRNSFSPHSKRG